MPVKGYIWWGILIKFCNDCCSGRVVELLLKKLSRLHISFLFCVHSRTIMNTQKIIIWEVMISVVSWHPALGKQAALGGYIIQVRDMEETWDGMVWRQIKKVSYFMTLLQNYLSYTITNLTSKTNVDSLTTIVNVYKSFRIRILSYYMCKHEHEQTNLPEGSSCGTKYIHIFTMEHILSERNMIVYLPPIQRIALIFFICKRNTYNLKLCCMHSKDSIHLTSKKSEAWRFINHNHIYWSNCHFIQPGKH